MSRSAAVVAAVIVAVVVTGASACGVVPVRSTPGPPPTWTYVDPHGRPRAFGGGVCPLQGRHRHGWPPAPASAFVDDHGAFRDRRQIAAFAGPHRRGARSCNIPTLHQHAIDVASDDAADDDDDAR